MTCIKLIFFCAKTGKWMYFFLNFDVFSCDIGAKRRRKIWPLWIFGKIPESFAQIKRPPECPWNFYPNMPPCGPLYTTYTPLIRQIEHQWHVTLVSSCAWTRNVEKTPYPLFNTIVEPLYAREVHDQFGIPKSNAYVMKIIKRRVRVYKIDDDDHRWPWWWWD